MTRLERWSLGLILIAMTCAGCRPVVPMVLRPDTRMVTGVSLPADIVGLAAKYVIEAYPNEVALCFTGTLERGHEGAIVVVDGVFVSPADSANEFHVWFSQSANERCGRHIGQAHSHTQGFPGNVCDHSHSDVSVLFEDPDAVFSMVICLSGEAQVLLQDGRRILGRWAS